MTSPTKTRIVVTVNIQRSTLTRLAIENPFHHGVNQTWEDSAMDFGQRMTDLVPWVSTGRFRIGLPLATPKAPYERTIPKVSYQGIAFAIPKAPQNRTPL